MGSRVSISRVRRERWSGVRVESQCDLEKVVMAGERVGVGVEGTGLGVKKEVIGLAFLEEEGVEGSALRLLEVIVVICR